jgi:hypothetical protein
MNDNERVVREWDRALERLAAEVTASAYAIAQRHGSGSYWIDLELELWEALTRTVREWSRRLPAPQAEGPLSGGSGNDCLQLDTVTPQEKE